MWPRNQFGYERGDPVQGNSTMLQRKILLATVLALLTLFTACQEETPAPANSTNTTASARSAPSPTEPPPSAERNPTPASPQSRQNAQANPKPTGTPRPLSATAMPTAGADSVSPAETAVPSPSPAHTATPMPTEAATHEENVAAIRRMVQTYWEAFNDYDADRALQMLEEGYRTLEDELIRKDIGRMKLFRIKLEVSEETPPELNEDGDYATYIGMKTPVDSRRVLMIFRRIEGQWRIVFSDEVEAR